VAPEEKTRQAEEDSAVRLTTREARGGKTMLEAGALERAQGLLQAALAAGNSEAALKICEDFEMEVISRSRPCRRAALPPFPPICANKVSRRLCALSFLSLAGKNPLLKWGPAEEQGPPLGEVLRRLVEIMRFQQRTIKLEHRHANDVVASFLPARYYSSRGRRRGHVDCTAVTHYV